METELSQLDKINTFKDLKSWIDHEGSGKYENFFDEGIALARNLISNVDQKKDWDPQAFEESHLDIPTELKQAIIRCIKDYNPPVNLPNIPLWE